MDTEAEILDDTATIAPDLNMLVGSSLAVGLSRAEIDTQIATARQYPRQITRVSQAIMSLATLDEETAEEAMYALPRGGKPIKGPSIRFAEIVKSSYGNCRAAARVVHVDRVEKVVIAEGIFHDLESNTASRAEVRRRICDKNGRLYKDDMIIVTGNAACAIALRNAILGGVPKALWRKAYDAVQHTIAGDIKTLAETRDRAIKSLAAFGVTPAQIFQALGVAGVEDVTIEHIPTLRGMFSALKNGEATVEEMFSGNTAAASNHEKVENPLSDEAPKPTTQQNASQAAPPPIVPPEMPPAPDSVSTGAGTNQESPLETPDNSAGGDEGEQAAGEGNPAPLTHVGSLPPTWRKDYAAALGRAMKPTSLPKFAQQFWALQNITWEQVKATEDGAAAERIYDAYKSNFGNKDAIEAALQEIGV